MAPSQTCMLTCLVISVFSGCYGLPALPAHSSSDQVSFYIPMQITNMVYDCSLKNPSSAHYKKLYKEVNELLDKVYNCQTIEEDIPVCPTHNLYGGVDLMTFRSASVGVIANATVMFDTNFINTIIVKSIFLSNAPRDAQLKLNLTFTERHYNSWAIERPIFRSLI